MTQDIGRILQRCTTIETTIAALEHERSRLLSQYESHFLEAERRIKNTLSKSAHAHASTV